MLRTTLAGADVRLLFRADASHEMGAGHVLRCLAIAQAVRDGVVCTGCEGSARPPQAQRRLLLASRDLPQALRARWEAEGASVLDATRSDSLREIVDTWRPDVAVLDGYHLGADVEVACVDAGAKLAVLDDNHERDTSRADLVINAGAHAASLDYGPIPSLRGPAFALLRRELRRAACAPGLGAESLCAAPVLVTVGGSDPRGLTAPLVERLSTRGVPVVALIGGLHVPSARLERACALPGVTRHEAAEDLVPLLSRVGWAVSAAGGTALELTALGHPVVALATVPNQRAAAHALPGPSFDLVELEGPALDHALDAAVDAVVAARRDHTRSRALAAEGRARIDGQGAVRVAHALASLAARRPAA
jgi:spore coat polysaccharide biosynthesis predicted glycosyltransferase SpsG